MQKKHASCTQWQAFSLLSVIKKKKYIYKETIGKCLPLGATDSVFLNVRSCQHSVYVSGRHFPKIIISCHLWENGSDGKKVHNVLSTQCLGHGTRKPQNLSCAGKSRQMHFVFFSPLHVQERLHHHLFCGRTAANNCSCFSLASVDNSERRLHDHE